MITNPGQCWRDRRCHPMPSAGEIKPTALMPDLAYPMRDRGAVTEGGVTALPPLDFAA